METESVLLIIVALLSALLLAYFQYIYKNKEESQLKYWLSLVRFSTIFLIIILLINPSFEKATIELIRPNLILAVDNSSSIKYQNQHENVQNIVKLFREDSELNEKFSVKCYSFGENLSPLDSLNFTENKTDFYKPFYEFSKIYAQNNNPLVLITDGNQTFGGSIDFINFKQPVFPIVVGDTTEIDDIFISRLNVNKYTFIHNEFPVEIFINYKGEKSISKRLSIYHKGTRIFSKNIKFSNLENVKIVSLNLSSQSDGNQYYTAKIQELENEQNIENNTKNFSIRTLDEKSEILILTSAVHPDLGMLQKAIESSKNRAVTFSKIRNFKGKLSDYQLVILYQPNGTFKDVFDEINRTKINYFLISGLDTDWEFLNKTQTNISKEVTQLVENYAPVHNPDYAYYVSEDIDFSSFPPIQDTFGEVTFNVQEHALLYKKLGAIETRKPLLASFKNGNQKIAILFGEQLWKWRMHSFLSNNTFEYFDAYISNLIHYLSSNIEHKKLTATVNPIYFENEIIRISAHYFDENLNTDNRAKLFLTVSNKELNFIKKIPFTLQNSQYVVALSNIPATIYEYTITVDNQMDKLSGQFKIIPFEVEKQFTQSNFKHLQLMAFKTNGGIYYNEQSRNLLNHLKVDRRFKSVQKIHRIQTPLIDWKWLLAILVFLLSVEWFVRKYYGKI